MEPIRLAVLLMDERGVITGLHGDTGQFGVGQELLGQPLREALREWRIPALQAETPTRPVRIRGCTPGGEPVFLEMFNLAPSRDPSLVALIRNQEPIAIPARFQQLCGLGEISSNVAHEINNALTILSGWLEVLRGDLADSPSRPTVELLLGEVQRVGSLTRNLQQVARGAVERTAELDLKSLLDEVATLVKCEMEKSGIALETRIEPDLPPVCGRIGGLKQAMLNLLANARQAMPQGGRIDLCARPGPNGHVTVSVRDTGCGIPSELQEQLFQPFFTTKPEGTGLGLCITRRIVEDHGGVLRLDSRQGEGTCVTLELPARGSA